MLKFSFQVKDQYGNHWPEIVIVDGLRTKADAERYAVKWCTCYNATLILDEGPLTLFGNVRILKADFDDCLHHQWNVTKSEPNKAGLLRYQCRRCGAIEQREASGPVPKMKLEKRL
jgi:hypothetical protein